MGPAWRPGTENQPDILTGTTEDDIDGAAVNAFEVVATQVPIVFPVTDNRFDGIAPFQLLSDAACHPTLLSRLEDLGVFNIVTTITEVNLATLGTLLCELLDLLQSPLERVAVVRITRQGLRAHSCRTCRSKAIR